MYIYIERYDKYDGLLIADFVDIGHYEEFCLQIKHEEGIKDKRTMLFIENLKFNKGVIPKEGKVYELPDEMKNWTWIKEPMYYNNIEFNEIDTSTIISFKINAKYFGDSFFEAPIKVNNNLYSIIEGNWNGEPCGLKRISENIEVIVKNVGQGNWNEIYSDNKCNIIYDLGASIYATKKDIRNIISNSRAFEHRPSVIISHWDVDHYQAIFEIDKHKINKICCIFLPNKLISQTSKRAFKYIINNCEYVCTIQPPVDRLFKRKISLQLINKGQNYAFFKGEYSSDINKSGLVLAVWNSKSAIILSGDHHYNQIFSNVLLEIPDDIKINLVTPHHGGHAGRIKNNILNPSIAELAITSTGRNSYGHPFNSNRVLLTKMGFNWIQTDYMNSDISIYL